ncbi:hydrogen gas-evolving membrane-bound hydrogenase subunit E [Halosimplex aquaticum]|uniref:Hydrogen gas-evolving membrane-bound hydrogenase subunit E n=1 Tax=Halosimplex aquaticum TaxID=3026162 RepID=A0ABD5Y8Y2_9EURY|nr:hydrogen gas-evolving membrane-bound hydrogenase subunit E [Halosimplex aquaticum]
MQPSPSALLALLALPFLGAALAPLVYRVLGERTAYFAAAVAAASLALVASLYGTHGTVVVPWIPTYGVSLALYVDGLALLIATLATGVGVLVFTYSGGYMHGEPGQAKYYATLLAFMGSMLGVAFASDLIALFVFWELTSVSSFLLIGHYQDADASQYAARKSMLITVAGGLFMLVGFLLLHVVATGVPGVDSAFRLAGPGSILDNADTVVAALRAQGLFVPVLLLVGVGAATKSAQVPFHIWLPNAMEAPTPVSAFLHSATMVKAGVYLVGRFRPLLVTDEWTLVFGVLGLATMTITAILAVAASDIKELLAYSTASHLGLIVAGYGMSGYLGAETGAFHILNHALFKAALFLVAGIVAHEAGTRAIDELGGLAEDLPITAGITAVAALGMAGVPPFNGFYSKEFLFHAVYYTAEHAVGDGGSVLWWLLPVVAVFGSVFTFLYSIRFLMLFFGDKPDALGEVHAPPLAMTIPAFVLGTLALLVGLGGIAATFGYHGWPVHGLEAFVTGVMESSLAHGGEGEHAFSYYLPTEVSPWLIMSAVTIAVGAVLYPFYDRIRDGVRAVRSVDPLRPNWYYDNVTEGLDRSAAIDVIQTGDLRTYAAALSLALAALALGAYAAASVALPEVAYTGLEPALVVVLGVAVIGAGAVAAAPSHISGVLTLSIVGFMVAIFYILGSAPDLALTQLVIETLVLVIFLLVLDKLPAFYGTVDKFRAARDAVVAGAVGLTVAVTVLLSTAAGPDDVIAQYFVQHGGVPEGHDPIFVNAGGGGNIVNVILVDFRAFDTLGEISVVAMAALSVITLIAMRERGEIQ